MTLAIQLVGCLGAVILVAALVRGDARRGTLAVSTAAVATVVVALVGLQGLWPTAKKHFETAKGTRALPASEVNAGPGRQAGVNADFVEWVLTQIPARERYFFASEDNAALQWTTYRMLPRLAVGRPAKDTWIVFYNTTPRKAGYTAAEVSDVRTYQPSFSIGRLTGATA